MKLWLCRHAAVLLPRGICYGATDVPADQDATEWAAAQCLQALPLHCPVWSSPLGRTRQLTQALLRLRPTLASSAVWDARLQEMNFGAWEMRAWDDIGQGSVDAWVADFAQHRVGAAGGVVCAGVDGDPSTVGRMSGESVNDLLTRVGHALHDAVREAHRAGASELVWVTHAGVIRAVLYLLQGPHAKPLSAATWPVDAPAMGGYCSVDVNVDTTLTF